MAEKFADNILNDPELIWKQIKKHLPQKSLTITQLFLFKCFIEITISEILYQGKIYDN